jgi:hypothetical protein
MCGPCLGVFCVVIQMLDTFQLPSHQYWEVAASHEKPRQVLRFWWPDHSQSYDLFNIALHEREMTLHEKSLTLHERSLTLHEKTLVLHKTNLTLYENRSALQKMTWPSRTVGSAWHLRIQISRMKFNFISITNSGNHLYQHGASGKHSPITHIIRRLQG